MKHLGFGVILALAASAAEADCAGAVRPCSLPGGTYHLVLPEGATGPVPAVMLLHGYGGGGLGTIRNRSVIDEMLRRGYAVIAPDGQKRRTGLGRTWDFHPDRPATRDEIAFLTAVAEDAAARHGLDRDRMLLAGFSLGGSMTSYLACAQPEAFAAYAPVAGSFWLPQPQACAGPVRLLHSHGTADRTVPLLGREISPDLRQGNVFAAIETWRSTNGCASTAPDVAEVQGIYKIQRWTECDQDARLDFALHEGGHSIPRGWAKMALDWFEAP